MAGFIGTPPMNFLPVTVSETSGSTFLETNGLRTKVPASKTSALQAYKGQQVTLGIRPEDLRVGSGADSATWRSTRWSRWWSRSAPRSCST